MVMVMVFRARAAVAAVQGGTSSTCVARPGTARTGAESGWRALPH
jgi:hypothetical protein